MKILYKSCAIKLNKVLKTIVEAPGDLVLHWLRNRSSAKHQTWWTEIVFIGHFLTPKPTLHPLFLHKFFLSRVFLFCTTKFFNTKNSLFGTIIMLHFEGNQFCENAAITYYLEKVQTFLCVVHGFINRGTRSETKI